MRKRSRSRSRDRKQGSHENKEKYTGLHSSDEEDPFGQKTELQKRRELRERIMKEHVTKDNDKEMQDDGQSSSSSE